MRGGHNTTHRTIIIYENIIKVELPVIDWAYPSGILNLDASSELVAWLFETLLVQFSYPNEIVNWLDLENQSITEPASQAASQGVVW